MDGVEYGFIPNLDDMSVGEFIDIETYTKETHDLWKVMSVLYRPVTHSGQNGRYEVAPYSANLVSGFKDLDCNTAFGAMVFFWSLGIDLLNSIQKYLEVEMEPQMKTALPKNGDGLEWSIDSLTEISYNWKMSILRPFTPLCIGPLTKATLRKWNKKSLNKVTSDEQ
jgi:heme/copper-type cytochrome/quinol oxidase subunit 1